MRWDYWIGLAGEKPTLWVKELLRAFGWKIEIHKFISHDHPECFHTHPAHAFRLVLWGGYVEELEGNLKRAWRIGDFGLVHPDTSHRILDILNDRPAYTLWIRGPVRTKIKLRGMGWLNHLDSINPELLDGIARAAYLGQEYNHSTAVPYLMDAA